MSYCDWLIKIEWYQGFGFESRDSDATGELLGWLHLLRFFVEGIKSLEVLKDLKIN